MSEPRKASDILLSVESLLTALIKEVRALDLNVKVLSNKQNSIMQSLEKQSAGPQKITVEAVQAPVSSFPRNPVTQVADPERQIPISAESRFPMDNSPQGFRRTSRPETFEGDDVYLPERPTETQSKYPVQVPKPPPGRETPPSEVVVPQSAVNKPQSQPKPKQQAKLANPALVQNAIPVTQRVVDKNGKSLFLADVEILSHDTGEMISKTRTNGTGKWQAALGIGGYRVTVRKRESLTKEKIEAIQDIQVDGSASPLELQTMIVK